MFTVRRCSQGWERQLAAMLAGLQSMVCATLLRYGRLDEVAQAAASVCMPAASHLTGAVIPVAGGLMARDA